MGRYIFPFLICTIRLWSPAVSEAGLNNFFAKFKKDKVEETAASARDKEHIRLYASVCSDKRSINELILSLNRTNGDAYALAALKKAPPPYDVPVVINKEVERFIKRFQTTGKKYFTKWLSRSGKYMPMIKEILRENDLPEDLAYLALIESGFSPHARSRANAVGIWQFMLWTGRYNGLRTDWWIDERKDPEKASKAAAKHLGDLYEQFDSWYLAAAGYNAGAGRIRKAIRKNHSTDFWEIAKNRRTLKRETRNYIPKYLAAMIVAKNPEEYGFHDIKMEEPIAYKKIQVQGPTDIKVIARAAGVSLSEIKRLNPELRRWFTPPDYPGYEIKIPEDKWELYVNNMAQLPKQARLKFHKHKVRSGDTLSTIAESYRTSVRPIMYLNNLKSKSYIRAGSTLVVPVRVGTKSKKVRKRFVKATVPIEGTHIVRSGDTLWDISMRYNIPINNMLKWNKIKKSDTLRPGQRLLIEYKELIEAKADEKPQTTARTDGGKG